MYSPAILTETPEAITITHIAPKWLRLLLASFACIPMIGIYDMLLKPRWNWAAFTLDNPSAFAFAAIPFIIGVGCMGMVITILSGAVFGPDVVFVFDKKRRMLFYTESKRPFKDGLKLEIPFSQLAPIEVYEYNDSDGPTQWQVLLNLGYHGRAHNLYYYTAEQHARDLRDRLTATT